MTRDDFAEWLDRWVDLWRDQNPPRASIEALFSEDATWAYQPYESAPAHGRDSIVERWLVNIDPPGSWESSYEPFAMDGDLAIARGWSRYSAKAGAVRDAEFRKLLVCRFTADGRCRELVEWYMEVPTDA
jgi:hypothetical protein